MLQLLCTFCKPEILSYIIDEIWSTTDTKKLFIFTEINDLNADRIITYNITAKTLRLGNTISIHRYKPTNTLYSINALNTLVKRQNNGNIDKNIQIDWTLYKNSLLITTHEEIKQIKLKIEKVIVK